MQRCISTFWKTAFMISEKPIRSSTETLTLDINTTVSRWMSGDGKYFSVTWECIHRQNQLKCSQNIALSVLGKMSKRRLLLILCNLKIFRPPQDCTPWEQVRIAIVSTLIILNLKYFQDHVMSFHHLSSRQSNH